MGQSVQIEANIVQLTSGIQVIDSLPESCFSDHQAVLLGASIGEHWRHILEHLECLLRGIETRSVDYTSRRRDPRLELDIPFSLQRARELRAALTHLDLPPATALSVRHEPVAAEEAVVSSLGREFEFLFSHTAHHYAMIAIALLELGIERPPGFGLAESTRQYQAAASAQAADNANNS